jgi:hypothetical protein
MAHAAPGYFLPGYFLFGYSVGQRMSRLSPAGNDPERRRHDRRYFAPLPAELSPLPSRGGAMSLRHKFVLDANGSRIADAYLQALKRGDDRPVIVVFDMQDSIAYEMAEDLVGRQMLSEFVANAECHEMEETFIWTLPHDAAINELGNLTPNGRQDLERLTLLDLLPVAIITCGALLWAGFPKPYIEPLRAAPRSREN